MNLASYLPESLYNIFIFQVVVDLLQKFCTALNVQSYGERYIDSKVIPVIGSNSTYNQNFRSQLFLGTLLGFKLLSLSVFKDLIVEEKPDCSVVVLTATSSSIPDLSILKLASEWIRSTEHVCLSDVIFKVNVELDLNLSLFTGLYTQQGKLVRVAVKPPTVSVDKTDLTVGSVVTYSKSTSVNISSHVDFNIDNVNIYSGHFIKNGKYLNINILSPVSFNIDDVNVYTGQTIRKAKRIAVEISSLLSFDISNVNVYTGQVIRRSKHTAISISSLPTFSINNVNVYTKQFIRNGKYLSISILSPVSFDIDNVNIYTGQVVRKAKRITILTS